MARLARRALTLGFVALLTLTQSGAAQGPRLVPRLANPIQFDGHVDEPAWKAIEPLPLTMYIPLAGARPTDSSEVRLAYDDNYLYASGQFWATNQAEIQASTLTRDRQSGVDDHFHLLLDTFNDNESASVFQTTPAGVQIDYEVVRDGAVTNDSWNTYWDVATSRDSAGWYMEMRIPFSSLRFQRVGDQVIMGLIAARLSAKKNELSTYPAVSPRHANAPLRPSIAQKIGLAGARSRRPLYFTPYLLGKLIQAPRLMEADGVFVREDSVRAEVGGDLKYSLTNNLTLDLTANTDFAQVEVDSQQVNLTRFSLFFPEKRQFFQERSSIFDLPAGGLGDPTLLFHSRRIGLTSDGRTVRIYGGARAVGRVGGWDLGVLDMHTAEGSASGSENLGVIRVRRRVLNEQSTVGTMVTSRLGSAQGDNVMMGIDARIQALANDYLTVQAARSFQDEYGGTAWRAARARVAWERPGTLTSQGLAYRGGLTWSGPAFAPGLGFDPRSDYHHAWLNARFGWFPGPRSAVRVLQPSVAAYVFHRNEDGSTESAFLAGFLNYAFKSGVNGYLGVQRDIEDLREPLPLSSSAIVPAGKYRYTSAEFALFPSGGKRLQGTLFAHFGRLYDGTIYNGTLSAEWVTSEHLRLSLSYQPTRIRFRDRGQRFDADLVQVRITSAVTTRLSGEAFVQYNQAARTLAGNFRIRYRFAEGRDLYLVYNEALNTDLEATRPGVVRLPRSQGRGFFIKYTYTLGI